MSSKNTVVCDICGKEMDVGSHWEVEITAPWKNRRKEGWYERFDLCQDCVGQPIEKNTMLGWARKLVSQWFGKS